MNAPIKTPAIGDNRPALITADQLAKDFAHIEAFVAGLEAAAKDVAPVVEDDDDLAIINALVPKLRDIESASRHQHALLARATFREALTWLDIYSDERDVVEHWKGVLAEPAAHAVVHAAETDEAPGRRRRRRRRRRGPVHTPAA